MVQEPSDQAGWQAFARQVSAFGVSQPGRRHSQRLAIAACGLDRAAHGLEAVAHGGRSGVPRHALGWQKLAEKCIPPSTFSQ